MILRPDPNTGTPPCKRCGSFMRWSKKTQSWHCPFRCLR